jgi:hypothetical protein
VKEAMLAKWSKESCMAAIEKDKAGSSSVHGSRSGTNRSGVNGGGYLAANGQDMRDNSPGRAGQLSPITPGPRPSNLNPQQHSPLQRNSTHELEASTPHTSSDQAQPTLHISDLKKLLAGGALVDAFRNNSTLRNSSPLRNSTTNFQDFGGVHRPTSPSAGSESLVNADGFESASEGDLDHPLPTPQSPIKPDELAQVHNYQTIGSRTSNELHSSSRPTSSGTTKNRPRTSSSASAEDPNEVIRALKGEHFSSSHPDSADDDVPPVPPLPESFIGRNRSGLPQRPITADLSPRAAEKMRASDGRNGSMRESVRSGAMGGTGTMTSTGTGAGAGVGQDRRTMVQQLLSGIIVGDVGSGKGVIRPPY